MARPSIFDTLIVLSCGFLLLGLILVAVVGTFRQAQGETLIASFTTPSEATPRTSNAAVTATITPLPSMVAVEASATVNRLPTETPRATHTPDPNRTPTPTRTPRPRATATVVESGTTLARTPAANAYATPPLPSIETLAPTPDMTPHYLLQRPVSAQYVDTVDRFYPYASTGEGAYPVHHGVEFVNELGTPVLAAGAGRVVVAQNDATLHLGPSEWVPQEDGGFYGNVVVIEHEFEGKPIYTLYGHMNELLVEAGDSVEAGDMVGRVGMSGVALGPHVHFEVRQAASDYNSTQNPELWFPPKANNGTLMGQVLDLQGRPVSGALVTLHEPDATKTFRYAYTYGEDLNNPAPSDVDWQENLVMGEVPRGSYRVAVRINGSTVIQTIEVKPGEMTWVRLQPGRN